MDIAGLLTVLFSFVNMVLLFVVIFNSKKKQLTVGYSMVVVSIVLWSLATFLYNNNKLFATVWGLQIIYILSYFMLLSYCFFVYVFPRKINTKFNFIFWIVIILLIPSLYVLLLAENVVLDVVYFPDLYTSVALMGPGYLIYTLPNITGLILLSIYFYLKIRRFKGHEKSQILLFLGGSILMFVPIVLFDYLVPLLGGSTRFYKWGPSFTVFFWNMCYIFVTD